MARVLLMAPTAISAGSHRTSRLVTNYELGSAPALREDMGSVALSPH